MTDRNPIGWFTANGKHIPIFEKDADYDEQKKEREIRNNKSQADKMNGKTKTLADIQEQLKSENPDYDSVAMDINNAVEPAGYFSLEKDGKTTVYGKAWNDAFFDLTPSSKDGIAKRLLDSVDIAKTIKNNAGNWDMHKYDGQVKFPATLINKKAPESATFNAIILQKAPTDAKLTKIMSTPEYIIYSLDNAGTDMFEYIAIKK